MYNCVLAIMRNVLNVEALYKIYSCTVYRDRRTPWYTIYLRLEAINFSFLETRRLSSVIGTAIL